MADTLDEISDGRLILGLGTGDSMFERRAMGYPTDHLVSRFEESLTIIRRRLREGALDFSGTYHRVDGFEMRPLGPRPGGPPILIGTLAVEGISHVKIFLMPKTPETVDGFGEVLALLDRTSPVSG